MKTAKEEREWLSRNWTPSDTTFRPWVASSTKAHGLVRDLIADVDDATALVKALAFWCSDRDHRPNELLDLAAAFLKEPKQ